MPILAGMSGRGVKPLTWASCVVALVGVGLLEQGGAPPGIGDLWNLLSALFFGLQVGLHLQRRHSLSWSVHQWSCTLLTCLALAYIGLKAAQSTAL